MRTNYINSLPGTEITDSDILAFYVWIPRYKYKVWNINKVENTDSYNARTTGIDIRFESGTETTGTINCTYNFNVDNSNGGIDLSKTTTETCTGSNGDYYTHPAFTFGDTELKGFWIGKFELSSETPSATNGGGSSTTLTARILPNVNSWRNNKIGNFFTVVQNMQTSNNIYGLSTDSTNTDSHLINNIEWGAVTYLTNSNYGRCSGGVCTEVTINNCSTYVTGIGGDSVDEGQSSTTCTTDANKYNGEKGLLASTTGNIYGVYDMHGGATENVMGNISSNNYGDTNFSDTWFNNTANKKYITLYYANTSDNEYCEDQTAYNVGKLGDATSEVVLTSGYSGTGWYMSKMNFPCFTDVWFARGSIFHYQTGSIFSFSGDIGNASSASTSRAVLVGLSS